MQVYAIEIRLQTQAQVDELVEQLENQCIQTVEITPRQSSGTYFVRVVSHWDDALHPELLELLV